MDQNDIVVSSQQLPSLSSKGRALMDKAIDTVMTPHTIEDSLALVQGMLNELDPQEAEDAFPVLQLLLESLGSFFLGLLTLQKNANFAQARDHFTNAVEGLNQVGEYKLRDLCVGMATYTAAIVELQDYNIGSAQELFHQTRDYLDRAGKFGQMFEPMIDHMQPDNLFLQGFQALLKRDYSTAKTLIEQAAQSADKVANRYYQPETPDYFTFSGLSYYYRSFYVLSQAFSDFGQFKYDIIASKIDISNEAVQAKDILSKGNINNPLVQMAIRISEGTIELLELIHQLASIMQMVLNTTFKPEPKTFATLRQRIQRANDSFGQAGQQAAVLVRLCDQLSDQINNLERLARPTRDSITPGPSVQETAAYESFTRFQNATLASLDQPIQQLSRWSMAAIILVSLSVLLIFAGAIGALFWNIQVGVVTSVSSVLSSLISSLLYVQLRQLQKEVKESRKDILKQFKEASERFFTKTPITGVVKQDSPAPEQLK